MATKEYLQSLIEEHGRTNDDLGSANEELVSGNEELQSMNEELETAKEELQSTNEELTTVNDELQSRNHEVVQVNSDLLNLLATVDIPIVILDRERRIRRFTPKARSILNVVHADLGRPLDDIKPNVDVPDLDRRVAEVIDTMAMTESEVQDRDGRWYRMQIRPYKTTDNKIDGAILSLVDIDALKHLVAESQQARGEAENANRAKDLFLAVLGHELRTPLASLLLQAQMLRRRKVVDEAKLIRVAEVIERATRMQMQLVDDLVDVSRIVAGKLKVELGVVDLSVVIKAALDGVSGPLQRKSLELDVVLDKSVGPVAGDAARLQQVVSNLLTNAIKFSPDQRSHQRSPGEGERVRQPQGERHRGRDRAWVLAPRLRSLFPGRHHQHAPVRRPRPRPGDRAPSRRAARRDDPGRQPRARERGHLLGDAPAHERAARGGERWGDCLPGRSEIRPARPPSHHGPARAGRGRRRRRRRKRSPKCSGRWAPR